MSNNVVDFSVASFSLSSLSQNDLMAGFNPLNSNDFSLVDGDSYLLQLTTNGVTGVKTGALGEIAPTLSSDDMTAIYVMYGDAGSLVHNTTGMILSGANEHSSIEFAMFPSSSEAPHDILIRAFEISVAAAPVVDNSNTPADSKDDNADDSKDQDVPTDTDTDDSNGENT